MSTSTPPGGVPSASTSSSQPKVTGITRSRNGCLVCRRRRVKCDKSQPECERCIKYGAECSYPPKKVYDHVTKRYRPPSPPRPAAPPPQPSSTPWRFDLNNGPPLSNAHPPDRPSPALPLASTSGPGPSSTPARITAPPLPSVKVMGPMETLLAMCRTTRMGSFFSGPLDPPSFLAAMFPDEYDMRCFHHCLTYTLSILVADEEDNPWTTHVSTWFLFPDGTAPLSTHALKLSMLALGATHLAYLHAKSGTSEASEKHRSLHLKYRREIDEVMRRAQHVEEERVNDKFLAACVATHCCDILSAHPRWREIIRMSDRAVKSRGGWERILYGNGEVDRGVWVIFSTYLLDLIGASMTTGIVMSPFVSDTEGWDRLEAEGADHHPNSSVVEQVTGVHRHMLRHLFTTMTLVSRMQTLQSDIFPAPTFPPASTHHAPTTPSSEIAPLVARLEADIAALENDLSLWPAIEYMLSMTPRVRSGSMIYLHACDILVRRELRGVPRVDEQVQRDAGAILDTCAMVGEKIEMINWPLIIAAIQLTDPDMREATRAHLKTFTYQCCLELEVIQMIVEESWARSDAGADDRSCGWREIMCEMGCSANLG
ncbi:hypothetical protein IAT38_003058 [Cryptococcus sp. DSM 104549]